MNAVFESCTVCQFMDEKTRELIQTIRAHIIQLAPYQASRKSGKLLVAALYTIEKLVEAQHEQNLIAKEIFEQDDITF